MNYDKVKELKENVIKLNPNGQAVIRKNFRADGYKNLLNKYGTKQDNSTAYYYEPDRRTLDMELTSLYETNGLFAKIIDKPAKECLRAGFDFSVDNEELKEKINDKLEALEFSDKMIQAIKWARLFGGALILMMIDDGRELDQPADWRNVKSIDELVVFERSIVQPDYTALYKQYGENLTAHEASKFMRPEYYYVTSLNGFFVIHESRCIVIRNGVLPERTLMAEYRFWGIPEYIRWKRDLKDTIVTHGNASKLLERSVQAVYKMKDLAQLLATDDGEDAALARLQLIDMARGFLNTIAIDGEGEDYSFQTFTLSGVKECIDATCQMLSAVTNVPQSILFGRSPAGMNSTGKEELENYYDYVEGEQNDLLKRAIYKTLDVILLCMAHKGEINEIPNFKVSFNSLWSLTEEEQTAVDAQKAQTAQTKAATAQIYFQMGALDPSEIRKGLMEEDEYNIEDLVNEGDEIDILSPEERTALLQYKMQDMSAGAQEGQIPPEMMTQMGNGMPNMNGGQNDPLNGVQKDEDDIIEGDGMIIRNGKAYIDVKKLGSLARKKSETPLTELQNRSIISDEKEGEGGILTEDFLRSVNLDGYNLKSGEQWITTESGKHIVVDKDGNAVFGNKEVVKAFNEARTKKPEESTKSEGRTEKQEGKAETKAEPKKPKFRKPKGFTVDKFGIDKLPTHFGKHVTERGEFGDITQDEYLKMAIEATQVDLDDPDIKYYYANVSDKGERHTGDEREIIIFNKKDGTYVKFKKHFIITFFKPKFNPKTKEQDLMEAEKYYEEKKVENDGTDK